MVHMKQFHFQYPCRDQRILSASSEPHCERKEKALSGLDKDGLFARTELYQFVLVQNGQPVLLMDDNETRVGELNVPCAWSPRVKCSWCALTT
jgi:hypothetical protein